MRLIYLYVIGVLFTCMSTFHMFEVSEEDRRGHKILGTGFTDNCELSCSRWDLNPGLPEEQPML